MPKRVIRHCRFSTPARLKVSSLRLVLPYRQTKMAISIKNREAETLLRKIQAVTHRGKSQIVLDLLRHEVARLRRSHQFESRRQRLESNAERLPQTAPSPDEIIGYDDTGLPR